MPETDDFRDEEARSNYNYPKEYLGARPLAEQIAKIHKIFNIRPVSAFHYLQVLPILPKGAEGWFAIPTINALAKKHFPYIKNEREKYCHGVQLVHEYIEKTRRFENNEEENINFKHLRSIDRTQQALQLITTMQKGDLSTNEVEIIIIAAQLGRKHRGRSVRRAKKMFDKNEFGLNSLAVGSIILTHPERLTYWDELDMDCAGDVFSPSADNDFSSVPYFCYRLDRLEYGAGADNHVDKSFGTASGFVPPAT